MRFSFLSLCILCILSIFPSIFEHPLYGQIPEEIKQTALRLGKLLGPKSYAKPPEWARPKSPRLFSFVWLSDMHLDEANRPRLAQTLQWIQTELKPEFLLLTGDNNAIVPAQSGSENSSVRNFRRQQYLQQWLDQHWKRPYAIIPGDNWPGGFDQVFGPRQYRVACGGVHLVLLAPDAIHHGPGMEGLSAFEAETFAWLRKDLQSHPKVPTLVAIHEPIYPPTFVDAPRLRKLLKEFPQIIGILQGHLHVDMQLRDGKQWYLVAPAVGPGQPPAFKYVVVYPDILIFRTAELDKTGQWRLVSKWQKIEIPPELQKPLRKESLQERQIPTRSSSGGPSWPGRQWPLELVSWHPAGPLREDPSLLRRSGQLLEAIRQFVWKEAPGLLLHPLSQ